MQLYANLYFERYQVFFDTFYKSVDKPVIIDREKDWGTPGNLDVIKAFVTPTPKIIITVRDILEIIGDYVKKDNRVRIQKICKLYVKLYQKLDTKKESERTKKIKKRNLLKYITSRNLIEFLIKIGNCSLFSYIHITEFEISFSSK